MLDKIGFRAIVDRASHLPQSDSNRGYKISTLLKAFIKRVKRMSAVFRFIVDKSYRSIRIDKVAAVANMTTTAFCRYFKPHTQKPYRFFLNKIRINNAYMLLQKKDISVVEVCHIDGSNNLSNFNRTFRKIMGKALVKYKRAEELR